MKLKYILLASLLAALITGCSCNCGSEIENLQVYFQYDNGNVLNTFDNSLAVKDGDGEVVKTDISLSNDEKRAVAELAGQVKFFSLPDTIKSDDGSTNLQELRIKVGVLDKRVVWYEPAGDTEEELSIAKISGGIKNLLHSNNDYREVVMDPNQEN